MKSEKTIDIENMAALAESDKEVFALNRRKGFGASDSSILLGVNHWTTLDELITQKNSTELTAEELEIGEKPQVRMGADLEPLILQKFKEWSGFVCCKPDAQFRLDDYPFLTVNYDGMLFDLLQTPVECKCVSTFARKYWKFDRALQTPDETRKLRRFDCASIREQVEMQADDIGIPPYYYTQVQQQLIGVPSDHAYLVALDVKEWKIHVFYIPEDDEVQTAIVLAGAAAAERCREIPNALAD